jgi:hypothetical protein
MQILQFCFVEIGKTSPTPFDREWGNVKQMVSKMNIRKCFDIVDKQFVFNYNYRLNILLSIGDQQLLFTFG